jgi:hypothetical protein
VTNPVGPLVPSDEGLCHQIADTFAVVGSSDHAWTEKICAMAASRDGTLQLGFGLGKYTNRNVMDAYAGVSRGVEQITVRASRRLSPEPALTVIGPIRYDIVEPFQRVRFSLEANETQPIAFEWLFEGTIPPSLEERTHLRSTYRTSAELVRYHQMGRAIGWIEIDGVRTEMTPAAWVSTRDHSWGVRYGVGLEMRDLEPPSDDANATYDFFWTPSLLERPDGLEYGVFMVMNHFRGTGYDHKTTDGSIEHANGHRERIVDILPELQYDTSNRRVRGGQVHCTMADGSRRSLHVEAVSDTGFHLGTGLYFGFDGHHHGEWRGALHVDGERIADCAHPDTARRVHQIRDTVVRVTDPTGGGTGVGNWQSVITGEHPHLGLSRESSFW